MGDLLDFSKRMGTIGRLVEANSEKAVRQVALAADSAVVTATPVDTGRARSNWLVEIDAPAAGTREPYSEGSKLGLSETENLNGALEQGASKIAQYKVGNSEIHITNNLPYIEELNNGSSSQAPENFVEIGVAAAAKAVEGARLVPKGGS